MSERKAKKHRAAQLEDNGFRWEEWRDGVLVRRGVHNGSTLDGSDATWKEEGLCVAIPASALASMFYGKK